MAENWHAKFMNDYGFIVGHLKWNKNDNECRDHRRQMVWEVLKIVSLETNCLDPALQKKSWLNATVTQQRRWKPIQMNADRWLMEIKALKKLNF